MEKDSFLLPNHFLSMHEKKTTTGRVYWTATDKKLFCKIYLGLDYRTLDKDQLHFFMFSKRGGVLFSDSGLPIWEYTKKPIRLEFQNSL